MTNSVHTVTIEHSTYGETVHVWLDGIPLKGLVEFNMEQSVHEPLRVNFTIYAHLGDVPNKVKP